MTYDRHNPRAVKAHEFYQRIRSDYSKEIEVAIAGTNIFDVNPNQVKSTKASDKIEVTLFPMDSVSTLFELTHSTKEDFGKICVHDFASFAQPGGDFLGRVAQEEAICTSSILYPVWDSFRDKYYSVNPMLLNRGLFADRAIYSEDVVFFETPFDSESSFVKADVLGCSAPNWRVGRKYRKFSAEENLKALGDRVCFIFQILSLKKVDTFLTGAWGCGSFGQSVRTVVRLMVEEMKRTNAVKQLIFAMPPEADGSFFTYGAAQKQLMDTLVV